MKKILGLTIAALLVMALVGGGTWAYFSDVETSTGNIFTAGTLNLNLAGGDADVAILTVTAANVAPGDSNSDSSIVDNVGSIAGELDIGISAMTNLTVTTEEPENDQTTDTGGDLGSQTWMALWLDYEDVGSWSTNDVGLKSDGSTYTFAAAATGTATGGSIVTIVDSGGGFGGSSEQVGYPVTVTGTVNGTAVIISHTDTELTVATPFSAAITNESYSIASGPHYDLVDNYASETYNAAVATVEASGTAGDDYDFNIEWVIPVTVDNRIMSDSVSFDLTFTLEQAAAD